MLDTAGADQLVADMFYIFSPAMDNEHLQAILVIEVDMGGGDDGSEMPMLQVRQEVREFSRMTVINDGDGPYRLLGPRFPFSLHQAVADQVSYGFRPVCISLAGDKLIEFCQEVMVNRDTEAGNFHLFT